jgi:hypothetical protein
MAGLFCLGKRRKAGFGWLRGGNPAAGKSLFRQQGILP